MFTYLIKAERKSHTDENSHVLVVTLQIPVMAKAEPGQNLEPRMEFRSPKWVAEM